jgi:hypothetical protein
MNLMYWYQKIIKNYFFYKKNLTGIYFLGNGDEVYESSLYGDIFNWVTRDLLLLLWTPNLYILTLYV